VRDKITSGVVAAALMGLAQPVLADQAETKGGLTVKTDDGRFEFKLGGRFHIDAYSFLGCDADVGGTATECPAASTVGGMFLRRGYITASGKLYGWKFKSEFDPAASSSAQSTWREVWVSTEALGGEIMIGQFKPFRSMEELTSSNEILMMERPYSTASSLYGGGARQFQMGVGYKLPFPIGMWAIDVHNIHAIGAAANEGLGASTRLTFLPIESERTNVHFGLVYGQDDANSGTNAVGPGAATIAGRSGSNQVTSPTVGLGTAGVGKLQTTYAAEAAAAFGPVFLQSEYTNSTLEQVAGTPDQDVTSYYLQGSFFLTGETKPYKKDRATFGTPKPTGEHGAWELTGRYDFIENPDLTGATGQPEVTQITAGVNYYFNPNVRLMLNYSMGEGETTNTGTNVTSTTEVDAIAVRTQLTF
jgi:phosphate-selective porin OprO and OprP